MGKRTGLQKMIALAATAALAATVLAGCGAPAEPGLPEMKWTQISEGQYRKIAGGDGADLILESVPQEIDHEVILEQLVDPNVEPDLAAVEAVKNDPNATLPDNYLPDGRVLMENWIELERQIVEVLSKTERAVLRDGELKGDFEESKLTIKPYRPEDGMYFGEEIVLSKIVDGNTEYLLTSDYGSLPKRPGTDQYFCIGNRNIGLIDLNSGTVRGLVPETYKGMTYEEVWNRHLEQTNWDILYWCNGPEIDPSGTKLVYSSDKEELAGWNSSIFMIHLEGDVPTQALHASSEEYDYHPIHWLNEEEFMATKSCTDSNEVEYVVINARGEERTVELKTDEPFFIETRDGLISYMDTHNIWVEQYQGDGVFETVAHIPLGDGTTALRGGQEHFSPSGKLFVFSYQPSLESWDRLLQIYDTEAQKLIAELEIPEDVRKPAGISEFWWISEEELLVTVWSGDPMEGNEIVSTWIYNVNGD